MTESPLDVWIQQAVPAGSGRYYALLHSENQSQTSATLALISVWSKLCFSNREIDAAKKQMEWWRQELTADTPKHPVTQHLNSLAENSQAKQHRSRILQEVLQGYSALLTEGSPSREQANRSFHHRTGAMAAIALSNNQSSDAIKQVGIALSQLRCIRHLRKHVANGLLCLPYEEMTAAGVSPKDLAPGNYSASTVEFLHAQLKSIEQQLEQSLPQLPHKTADSRFLYVYAHQQRKLLLHIRRNVATLEQHDIRLSPLRYFWTARRAARDYRRQSNTHRNRQ